MSTTKRRPHEFKRDVYGDADVCATCDVQVTDAAMSGFTVPCPAEPCPAPSNPQNGCLFVRRRGSGSFVCCYCGTPGARRGGAYTA